MCRIATRCSYWTTLGLQALQSAQHATQDGEMSTSQTQRFVHPRGRPHEICAHESAPQAWSCLAEDEVTGLQRGVSTSGLCRVVVLDHHKTASEALEGSAHLPDNMEIHLDMERSGATISLDYFQPQVVTEP